MRTLVIVVFASVALLACKSTGLKVGNIDIGKIVSHSTALWDANNIDQTQEIQIGQQMSAVLLGTRPLIENKEINIYVNQVGTLLASHTSRPDLPWRFGVINSSAINAFAAPGGYIFITSGMLMQVHNEAQLAAVLAHEIIHVVEKHHIQALKEGAFRNAATETLFMSAEMYQNNTGASQQDREYTAWARKFSDAGQTLYAKGLSKDDEFIADQQGIRLLAKAGYDPFAFVENLQLLASIAPDDSSLALMYKTHPTPDQRLIAIQNQLTKLIDIEGKQLNQRYAQHVH